MIKELIERRKKLKAKFKGCQRIFAGWTSFGHPSITEIFSKTGVDFIGLDMEHSTISQKEAQRIIAAAQGEGTLCVPRIATHNMEMVKHLLDSGADGIMAPLVSSKEEAEQIVSWCQYPSAGQRSFGVARAQGYGLDYDEYTREWNDSFSLIVQIESKQGVENIEEILSVKAIDGVMIGPYDISGSLGIPGQLEHAKVKAACKKVIVACKKFKKSCGNQIVMPDEKNVQAAFNEGFNFVVLGSDLFFLWKCAERMRSLIKPGKKTV